MRHQCFGFPHFAAHLRLFTYRAISPPNTVNCTGLPQVALELLAESIASVVAVDALEAPRVASVPEVPVTSSSCAPLQLHWPRQWHARRLHRQAVLHSQHCAPPCIRLRLRIPEAVPAQADVMSTAATSKTHEQLYSQMQRQLTLHKVATRWSLVCPTEFQFRGETRCHAQHDLACG